MLCERCGRREAIGMTSISFVADDGLQAKWTERLDIAFLDSTGVIRAARSMTPCPTTIAQGCPSYTPDVPYRYALEVNAGFFARHALAVGHALVLRDVPGLPAAATPSHSTPQVQ